MSEYERTISTQDLGNGAAYRLVQISEQRYLLDLSHDSVGSFCVALTRVQLFKFFCDICNSYTEDWAKNEKEEIRQK